MRKLTLILLPILMSVAFCNCKSIKTIEVEKPIYCYDTIETLTARYDSIYVDHYREVYTKADTVSITDSIVIVRYKLEKDTVYRYIEKPIEITKKVLVDNGRNSLKDIFAWSGAVAILLGVAYLLIWVRKKM